jgi:hypothetical protein
VIQCLLNFNTQTQPALILTAYRHHSSTAGKNYELSSALTRLSAWRGTVTNWRAKLCLLCTVSLSLTPADCSVSPMGAGASWGRVHVQYILPIPASVKARHDATWGILGTPCRKIKWGLLCKKKIPRHIKMSANAWSTKYWWNQKLIAQFCCTLRDEHFKPN